MVVLTALFSFSGSYGQSLNANWERDLSSSLEQFLACTKTTSDKYSCSSIGKSLSTVYNLNVFYSEELKRYLMPNEIVKSLKAGDLWTLLGYAYDQKVLNDAQQCANLSKAVVAVYTTPAGVHVALILPGTLRYSGSWGYNVPNSATMFYSDPEKSYVGKGLSYGFAKNMIKDITLYCKNY